MGQGTRCKTGRVPVLLEWHFWFTCKKSLQAEEVYCTVEANFNLQKAVMISHRNIIANVVQSTVFELPARKKQGVETQVTLGLLPLSHIYGLTMNALLGQYRGDEVVILAKFELITLLKAIERFKLAQINVVPPLLIQLLGSKETDKYDLSSVRFVFSGAAPLGTELTEDLLKKFPSWKIGQGYGMFSSPNLR